MRVCPIAGALIVLITVAAVAAPAPMTTVARRVRSLDPNVLVALREGITRSATVRRLVDTIEESDVIVYLQEGACHDAAACTMIAETPGPGRLLRVNFVLRTPAGATVLLCHRDRLVAQIAHELQHAVEIANNPDVASARSLENLYRRIGIRRGNQSAYESSAAIEAGERALAELGQPEKSVYSSEPAEHLPRSLP
jgi:hypothetical protein